MYDKLNEKIFLADGYIKKIISALSPLYKKDFAMGQDVTIPLFTALHSYSESILILLQNGAVFEADILLRCTMEGTVRYCYLMIGDEKEREVKYNEYKIIMPEIDRLNDHKKAKDAVGIIKKYSNNNTKPFETMILSDEEVDNIKNKYTRNIKNELKKKWSYQSLLKTLASTHKEYEAQLGSLSTYALTSHYCHLDFVGLNDIQNRIYLSKNDGNIISDYAHSLRIIDNIVAFYAFRVLEYMRCNNYFPEEASKLCLGMIQFSQELNAEINNIVDNNL
ncbi:MAG: hypothetical protein IJ308_01955 [Clostridia bacterium]|nr:hypothetical protein [Clostridia bacterium]